MLHPTKMHGYRLLIEKNRTRTASTPQETHETMQTKQISYREYRNIKEIVADFGMFYTALLKKSCYLTQPTMNQATFEQILMIPIDQSVPTNQEIETALSKMNKHRRTTRRIALAFADDVAFIHHCKTNWKTTMTKLQYLQRTTGLQLSLPKTKKIFPTKTPTITITEDEVNTLNY